MSHPKYALSLYGLCVVVGCCSLICKGADTKIYIIFSTDTLVAENISYKLSIQTALKL